MFLWRHIVGRIAAGSEDAVGYACDVQVVDWRTTTRRRVVDVDAGTSSSGDRRGCLEVKDIAIAGLERFTSPWGRQADEDFAVIRPEPSSHPRDRPDDRRLLSPDKNFFLSPSAHQEDTDLLHVDCAVLFVYSVYICVCVCVC